MTTGRANRGEWGEPYVAMSLLGNGKIFMCDENGQKMSDEWMNVIDVIRHETQKRMVMYHYSSETTMVDIIINGVFIRSLPANLFLQAANKLADEVITSRGRTFSVSNDLMRFIKYEAEIEHIKAMSDKKNDIFVSVSDPRSSVIRRHIGFSIKTKFGHNPTLFNTAKASAVKYRVDGMTEELMEKVNSLFDQKGHAAVIKRCRLLKENGCKLAFVGFPIAKKENCETFRENLDLIDNRLIFVIERILWNHFFNEDADTDIEKVTQRIIEENPCNVTRPEIKYPYMIKSFLYAAYCGMTASTVWDGKSDVNGGFISVEKSGEVLAHYALESEAFKNYLFKNCYMEFPSTSEKHGDYAKVYYEEGRYFYNLNFQIRYR